MDSFEFTALRCWLVDGMSFEEVDQYIKKHTPKQGIENMSAEALIKETLGLSDEFAFMFDEVMQYEYLEYSDVNTAFDIVELDLNAKISDDLKSIIIDFWEQYLSSEYKGRTFTA